MANVANGLAYSARNSQWPLAMNSSSWRSTSCHMKSSFSFSRFGVNNLVSKERARVVGRRIHDDQVLVDREHVAVRLDQRGDVVTLGLERQRGERATDRVYRREGIGVFEGRHDLRITRDGNHAVVRLAKHRALTTHVIQVLVGVLGNFLIRKIVDGREIRHHFYRPFITTAASHCSSFIDRSIRK